MMQVGVNFTLRCLEKKKASLLIEVNFNINSIDLIQKDLRDTLEIEGMCAQGGHACKTNSVSVRWVLSLKPG